MEKHFVCPECKYESHLAGTCPDEDCLRQGERLQACHCEDGMHASVIHVSSEEETGESGEKSPDSEESVSHGAIREVDLDDESSLA